MRVTLAAAFLGICACALGQPVPPPAPGGGAQGAQEVLPPPPGGAQPEGQVVPAVGPQGAAAGGDPKTVWEDVKTLSLAAELGLTAPQAAQIRPLLEQLQATRQEAEAARLQLWQQSGEAVEQVIVLWIAAREAPADLQAAADAVAAEAARHDEAVAGALEQAEAGVLAALSPQQQDLIETYEDYEARLRAQRLYEGAPSLADYIVRQLTAMRHLMPDEYDMVRTLYAGRIARRISPVDGPRFLATQDAVLQLLDQVASWDDQRFDEQLPTLAQQVRDFLALPEAAAGHPVRFDDLEAWLSNPRTGKYMAVWGTATAPLPADPPQPPDQMKAALQRARLVTLLNQLGLGARQAADLQPIAAQGAAAAAAAEANRSALATLNLAQLSQALPALLSGPSPGPQWRGFVAKLQAMMAQQDSDVYRSLIPGIQTMREILDRRQAALVDWRVPPEVAAEQDVEGERLLQREMLADISDAVRFMSSLRSLQNTMYRRMRLVRTEEWLSHYISPEEPDFLEVRDRVADEISRTRPIPREEWEAGADIATAVTILGMAGRQYEAGWEPSDRPLSWYDMADLLKDPQTAEVLQQMAATRGG